MATATSRLVSTWRPSPLAWPARCASASSSAVAPSAARPRSMSARAASRSRALSRNRVERDSSGGFTSKKGFSVVAPMRVSRPLSTAGQQRVLLGLAEAVDLVEEQDRALAPLAEPLLGPLEHLADVLHPGADRRELLERLGGVGGDGLGQGRLARARRPPEDHRREPVGLDEGPQRLAPARAAGPGRRCRRASAAAAGRPAARSRASRSSAADANRSSAISGRG